MNIFHRSTLAAGLSLLLLAACDGGSATSPETGTPAAGPALSGTVFGGQSALVGSAVTLYAAGSTSGGSATSVGTATTGTHGGFNIPLNCSAAPLTPTTEMYVTVAGGSAGGAGPSNSAITLELAMGECQNLPNRVGVNELTTVASAYALNAFHGSGGISGPSPGLQNAFATVASLVDAATGGLAATLPEATPCAAGSPPANCMALERLNALANALAACINSSSAGSGQCVELFACATPGASFSSGSNQCSAPIGATLPTNSLAAALNIARNPGTVAVEGLYELPARNAVFSPVSVQSPTDWTLSLNFTGNGLSEPTQAAIDADGDVWLANYNGGVSEFTPSGATATGSPFTGGGLAESFGIAIDANSDVWVTNEQTGGDGTITELGPTGTRLSTGSGYTGGGLNFPEALAVDGSGNIWVANYGNSTLSELEGSSGAHPGMAISPGTAYTGGGVSYPEGIAVDGSGSIWLSDTGTNTVSEFNSAGTAVSATGYTGGGLDVPQALAIDQLGNVWVANFYGDSVTELDSAGSPVQAAAFGGAGLVSPGGVAIDGAGNVWVTNYYGGSLSELEGAAGASPGTALSPAITGFSGAGLSEPFSPAIDSSGNLWTGNYGNDSVTEFIGVAAPVKTPLIGLPKAP